MSEKIIEKISKYNFFNYLLPGILFIILAPNLLGKSLLVFSDNHPIASLFLAYFLGMVISRVGSIVIEPILKRINLIKFAEHDDYLVAAEKDEKLDILSEENNIFRTLVSLFSILLLIRCLIQPIGLIFRNMDSLYIAGLTLCLILFLFSYRKQTIYIAGRIKKILNKKI